MDLYEAFERAHASKTALQNKKIHAANSVKVNELELDSVNDPEEWEAVEALQQQFAQKQMFSANNGSAYQPRSGGSSICNSSNGATYQGNSNRNGNPSAQPQSGQRKPNLVFGKICHYCKKKNHFQSDCFKHKRDNSPMVQVKEISEENCKFVFTSKN